MARRPQSDVVAAARRITQSHSKPCGYCGDNPCLNQTAETSVHVDLPLTATDFIAAYAALVATVALGWQILSSLRARRPQVAVLLDDWRTGRTTGWGSPVEEAKIRIRNREGHPVQVDRLDFSHPRLSFRAPIPAVILEGAASKLPFEVPARNVVRLTLRPTRRYVLGPLSGNSGPGPFPRIRIELRTGEIVTSSYPEPPQQSPQAD